MLVGKNHIFFLFYYHYPANKCFHRKICFQRPAIDAILKITSISWCKKKRIRTLTAMKIVQQMYVSHFQYITWKAASIFVSRGSWYTAFAFHWTPVITAWNYATEKSPLQANLSEGKEMVSTIHLPTGVTNMVADGWSMRAPCLSKDTSVTQYRNVPVHKHLGNCRALKTSNSLHTFQLIYGGSQ